MLDGAFGVSTGLVYAPGCYANLTELVAIAKVVAQHGGLYVTHLRGEGETILTALQEALTVGRKADIPVHISHHKVIGRENWGRVDETLRLIDETRNRGLDVTCDQYPYTAGSTMLSAVIPPWGHRGGIERLIERLKDAETRKKLREDMIRGLPEWTGYFKAAGWENILVTYCKTKKELEGKTIAEIADHEDKDPFDTTFDLLVDDEAAPTMVIFHISERDMFTVMRHPCVMVATDGLLGGKPHPRVYGTYPRILGRYVRDESRLRLEDAVRKMTSFPASRLGLRDRGVLGRGMYADITIFDAAKIIDKATYDEPHQYPEGLVYVVVNGQIALEQGQRNTILAGQVLRSHQRRSYKRVY
jgi:N-acyl-D-amino-acid deacylase